MIFYASAIIHWIILLIYPLTFSDELYNTYLVYGDMAQSLCFAVCICSYFSLNTSRARSVMILLGVYSIYTTIGALFFGEIYAVPYMLETLFFLSWTLWIMIRPEYKTAKTINKDNILLAFYKGSKGSPIMNFFQLFGLPVKSLCIVADKYCLRLKQSKDHFYFSNTAKSMHKNKDYIVIDTGVPHTAKFIEEMEECVKMKATIGGMRVRCVEAISALLGTIGDDWKPVNFLERIPSIYLRKVIKL